MKIILLQDVNSLGKAGDIKDVADGYARNFLIPRKLSEVATEESIKKAEQKKTEEKIRREADLKYLDDLAQKLKGRKFTLKRKEKGGKLFGSVLAKDISQVLRDENLSVLESSIIMKEAIKKTGKYKIKIQLAPKIEAEINLEILGE